MNQRRLTVLLLVLVALLALHWWDPMGRPVKADIAQAVVRPNVLASPSPEQGGATRFVSAEHRESSRSADASAGTREPDTTELRNPFAVRQPPAPVAAARVPVHPSPPPAPPVVGPLLLPPEPPTPPPPPPPLQVIGSWRDDQGSSVFVAGPDGVLVGRVGDVLIGEYLISRITPQQVLLQHVPSNRDVPLAVPAGASLPLTASK